LKTLLFAIAILFSAEIKNYPMTLFTPKSTRLYKAIKKNNVDEVRMLLNSGANPNKRGPATNHDGFYKPGIKPLSLALKYANPVIIDLLLRAGADPNVIVSNSCLVHPPLTILGRAIKDYNDLYLSQGLKFEHFYSIELLLKAGASPNTLTQIRGNNCSLLEVAYNLNDRPLTRLLLQHHANLLRHDASSAAYRMAPPELCHGNHSSC
jgi:ankyrin repeat protein